MTDRISHCWHGENDDNEIGSDEWMEVFVRGERVCMLLTGHDGPHVYTPGGDIYTAAVQRGYDHGYAARLADRWEQRKQREKRRRRSDCRP